MKKIFTILILLQITNSFSQFNFGLRSGLTFSNQELSSQIDILGENKFSPYLGITSEYKFDKFAVSSDLTYITLGSKNNNSDLIINTYSLNILGKYYLNQKFNVGLGGFYSFFIDKKLKPTSDYESNFKNHDYGLVINTEYNLYENLYVELRYSYGLTNIFDLDYSLIYPTLPNPSEINPSDLKYEIKNRFINLGISYKF